jgi:hypothetical protein
MDYLNDRHTAINDNHFTISIEVADNASINGFVVDGVESVPAMRIHQDELYIYGVNSIIAALAKLETLEPSQDQQQPKERNRVLKPMSKLSAASEETASTFYDMIMDEMNNDEQEDPDIPSTIKTHHQDLPETPLNDNNIAEKMKAYEGLYNMDSKQPRKKPVVGKLRATNAPPTNVDIDMDKSFAKSGFDNNEENFIRELIGQ